MIWGEGYLAGGREAATIGGRVGQSLLEWLSGEVEGESVLEVADVYICPPELGGAREKRDALARASAISERAGVIAGGL
jgi:hypothetical protein